MMFQCEYALFEAQLYATFTHNYYYILKFNCCSSKFILKLEKKKERRKTFSKTKLKNLNRKNKTNLSDCNH